MRPLSQSTANRCENAKEPECKCRCGGALHGAKGKRIGRGTSPMDTDTNGDTVPIWFEQLPETDPHWVPSKKRAKELAKERARARRIAKSKARDVAWEKLMSERVPIDPATGFIVDSPNVEDDGLDLNAEYCGCGNCGELLSNCTCPPMVLDIPISGHAERRA